MSIFPLLITASKILVATGDNLNGRQTTSEIVDLTVKGGNMCRNWPKFPLSVFEATGGLIENTVMICGGYDDSLVDECYSLTSQKATFVTNTSVRRSFVASIVLNDNTLWVTGGCDTNINGTIGYLLASTEKLTLAGTTPGPDLPTTLHKHAIVAINSTVSMVIGGWDGNGWDGTASMFYYNHIEGEWSNGPILMQSRYEHAAGIVTDELTDEKFVAVTGGLFIALSQTGNYDSIVYLNSSEILQDGKWVEGKINNTINLLKISGHYNTFIEVKEF